MELNSADVSGSFQCPSPSELDRGFFVDQRLSVSALSLEGSYMSFLQPPNEVVALYSETKLSTLASLYPPVNIMSPSQASNLFSQEESRTPILTMSVEGKSSTPCLLLQKPKLASSLDLSYADLTASQVSWECSLIKPEANNHKPVLESSTLESTRSPKCLSESTPSSLAEMSSLIWSGTPPLNNPENQRSWREAALGSSQTSSGSAPVAVGGWQRRASYPAGREQVQLDV